METIYSKENPNGSSTYYVDKENSHFKVSKDEIFIRSFDNAKDAIDFVDSKCRPIIEIYRTTNLGLYIKFPKRLSEFQNQISSQDLNWWLNNEFIHYYNLGFKIQVCTQKYNPNTQKYE